MSAPANVLTRLLLSAMLLGPAIAQAQIIYVDADAVGANNGTSWANAFNKLQDALTYMRTTTTQREIWVAAGTYYPDEGAPPTFSLTGTGNRNQYFQLNRTGLKLYGGFAGNETLLSQRDIAANPTILSGDLAGNDTPNFGNRGDNTLHICFVTNNVDVRLDGFTVRGGQADGPANNTDNRGGALIALLGANTTISECTFTDNQSNEYGGAAFFFGPGGSGLAIRKTSFIGNKSGVAGGAIYFFATGIKRVYSCSFLGNDTGFGGGGGISGDASNLTLVNSVFIDNFCGSSGGNGTGGAWGVGGAPPTSAVNCTFANNRTSGRGGAGVSMTASNAAPVLSNCILWGNVDNDPTNLKTVEQAQIDTLYATPLATVQYSIVQGLTGAPPSYTAGPGNLALDPLFVDVDGANNLIGDADDDVRLLAASPAINTGNAALLPNDLLDLDDDAITAEPIPYDRDDAERVQCALLDIGAYESSAGAGPITIDCPPDVTLECPASPAELDPSQTGEPEVTGCGTITVTYADVETPGSCPGNRTIARTWTADNGSESASCVQTITVEDTTDPVITVPGPISIDCSDSSDPGDTGTASASDDCDAAPVVSYSDATVPGTCANQYEIHRTWTATDACGNSASGVQVITVGDTQLDVLTIPADATVSCGEASDPNATGVATAVGGCNDDPAVSYSDNVIAGACAAEFTIERTWTATDSCGNVVSAVQTITVVDNDGPAITLPGVSDVSCGTSLDPADIGAATASDACGAVSSITYSDAIEPGACPAEYTVIRTWTATDACGNASSAVQMISVTDVVGPVLSVPADATVECGESTDPSDTGAATASDACSDIAGVDYVDSETPGVCPTVRTITRTWMALDACGNISQADQTITVVDTTAPLLSVPPDATVVCGDSTDTALTGAASAFDACDTDPIVTFLDTTEVGVCPVAAVVTRTWSATDACGNTSSAVQLISLIDEDPPAITCPEDVNVTLPPGECDAEGLDIGFAVATDLCSEPLVENDAPAVFPAGTTYVTWTATDACGNTATCVQSVTVEDAKPPKVCAWVCSTMLWPPNHDLVNVGLHVSVHDACDSGITPTVTVYADEDDEMPTGDGVHSPDAKDEAPGTLRLRRERRGDSNGRVYLIIVTATDNSGNMNSTAVSVVVPHSRSPFSLVSVMLQAISAQAYFNVFDVPPPGFYLVGDGPIIGPKQ